MLASSMKFCVYVCVTRRQSEKNSLIRWFVIFEIILLAPPFESIFKLALAALKTVLLLKKQN